MILRRNKNKQGEDYEPESLKVTMTALSRHLKKKGYGLSIVFGDREFSSSKQVLEGKGKQLCLTGRGKRQNKARQVSEEEEEILWKNEKPRVFNSDNVVATYPTIWSWWKAGTSRNENGGFQNHT